MTPEPDALLDHDPVFVAVRVQAVALSSQSKVFTTAEAVWMFPGFVSVSPVCFVLRLVGPVPDRDLRCRPARNGDRQLDLLEFLRRASGAESLSVGFDIGLHADIRYRERGARAAVSSRLPASLLSTSMVILEERALSNSPSFTLKVKFESMSSPTWPRGGV